MGENSNRAKEIIRNILYITLATTSKEGWPWNSPVYSASDETYTFYWISYKNAQHSKNIAENRRVFIVIYDSTVPEGTGVGVYIQAKASVVTDEKEIRRAVTCLCERIGGNPRQRRLRSCKVIIQGGYIRLSLKSSGSARVGRLMGIILIYEKRWY